MPACLHTVRRKGESQELHRGTLAHKNVEKATDTRCRQETGQNLHEEDAPIRVWIFKDCHDLCNIRQLSAFEDEWLALCQECAGDTMFSGVKRPARCWGAAADKGEQLRACM